MGAGVARGLQEGRLNRQGPVFLFSTEELLSNLYYVPAHVRFYRRF